MQQMKILIADADVDACQQLTEIISGMLPDFQLHLANTGRQLFMLLKEQIFDLIFIDMVLSLTDTAKLKEVIEVAHALYGTRLVLVSEGLGKNWMAIALHLQACEVLIKPYRDHTGAMRYFG